MTTKRKELKPVTFVTVEQVFKPQVKVRATRSLSGWADRQKRVKWDLPAGRVGCMDADVAREFAAKGFVEVLDGEIRAVSQDELDEFLAQVTTIKVGDSIQGG